MAIFSLHHSPIGKSTQAQPYTAAAHINYITRRRAMRLLQKARLPGETPREIADYLRQCEDRDRKNARVIDKVMLALPLELGPTERVGLVREFAESVTKGRAPWLAAFHDKGKDASNPHCHLVIRDRDPCTGKRVIGTSEIGSTEMLRREWETFANRALERSGRAERVDRRTLAEQGIDREPTIHEGPQSQAMDRRGARPTSRKRKLRNRPGAGKTHREVDYQRIDNGTSRPDENRLRRRPTQETERDYWNAIDQDNQQRELQELAQIHNPHSVNPFARLSLGPAEKVPEHAIHAPPGLLALKASASSPRVAPSLDVGEPALEPSANRVAWTKPKDKLADIHRPRPRSFGDSINRAVTPKHPESVRQLPSVGKGHSMSDDDDLRRRKAAELKEAQHGADMAGARYDDLMGRSYLDPASAEKKMGEYRAKHGDQALHGKLAENPRKTAFGRRPGSILSRDGYTPGAPERRQDSQIARQYLPDAVKGNHQAQENLKAAEKANAVGRDSPSGSRSPPAQRDARDERARERMRQERKNDRDRER